MKASRPAAQEFAPSGLASARERRSRRPGPPSRSACRCKGSFSEQFPLLFRDFLRTHGEAAAGYAAVKRDLAARYAHQRDAYTDAKGPIVWDLIHRTDDWAQQTGWEPGPSDA